MPHGCADAPFEDSTCKTGRVSSRIRSFARFGYPVARATQLLPGPVPVGEKVSANNTVCAWGPAPLTNKRKRIPKIL